MFINVSAYKFVRLDNLTSRRATLLDMCKSLDLKGTILLSEEGINIFVAGARENVDKILGFLDSQDEYSGLRVKESESDEQPFTRMLVRIKKEIIAFGVDGIEPDRQTSPKLKPEKLKQWLDDGRQVTLLDVRNEYEVDLGTFETAIPIGVDSFRAFPDAVKQLPDEMKQETIVMFCTGGIRCEKAGPFMENAGFENIYQLDGGILQYFEDCGGKHYDGECFVFDQRVAVDAALNETPTLQCFACQHPLSEIDQKSNYYVVGQQCPYCCVSEAEKTNKRLAARNEAIVRLSNPLPGSIPYDNHRPMNVPLRFDKSNVLQFLSEYHPHVDSHYWAEEIENGRILYKDKPVQSNLNVWAGQRLTHLLAGTIEPDVACEIEVVFEDDALVAVNKPAPLAMHPCGRFNRNTLVYILNAAYEGEKIRMVHRLDANTTGIVVLARKREAAVKSQSQFESGTVRKTYLARVFGQPDTELFENKAPIAARPGPGGIRGIDEQGLTAHTEFKFVESFSDGTSLVECYPRTGRTNQIRLHLWALGFSICNDPTYLPDSALGTNKTLAIDDEPMCLHAWRLELEHPITGRKLEMESPRPDWCGNGTGNKL